MSTERVEELLLSEPSRLKFPAESQNLFDATEITPSDVLSAVGVKVAVKEVAEAAFQLERLPPETETSDSMKSEQDSESVKVRVAASPALREETSELTAMVGLMVSTERVTVLLLSDPLVLALLAASVKVLLATEITPSVVLLVEGVNVAE